MKNRLWSSLLLWILIIICETRSHTYVGDGTLKAKKVIHLYKFLTRIVRYSVVTVNLNWNSCLLWSYYDIIFAYIINQLPVKLRKNRISCLSLLVQAFDENGLKQSNWRCVLLKPIISAWYSNLATHQYMKNMMSYMHCHSASL